MKKICIILVMHLALNGQAALIAFWDFESGVTVASGGLSGTASSTSNGTYPSGAPLESGTVSFSSSQMAFSQIATSPTAQNDPRTSATAGSYLHATAVTGNAAPLIYTFNVANSLSIGANTLVLSQAITGSPGLSTPTWTINGTAFIPQVTGAVGNSWSVMTFTFTNSPAFSNSFDLVETFTIPNGNNKTLDMDNVHVTSTTVPEPIESALAVFGGVFVSVSARGWIRSRREKLLASKNV